MRNHGLPAKGGCWIGRSIAWMAPVLVVVSLAGLSPGAEPGPAAIDFLMKVRSGKVDLKPGGDTALQANTSPGKRQEIEEFVDRLRGDLLEGRLVAGGMKEEGGFAAVLVENISENSADEVRVFPVAMVRKGEEWRAAPVLASFENSVSGYTVAVRKKLVGLEDWMMRERVVELEKLVSESTEKMRDGVRKAIAEGELRDGDPGNVVSGFRQACISGDESALLGYLGGLSDPLPEDWAVRVALARKAAADVAPDVLPWRLFASEQVIWEVVDVESDGGEELVSIACLDPDVDGREQGKAQIDVFHVTLTRDAGGRWRLDLPAAFLGGEWDESDFSGDLDVDLQVRFLELLRKKDAVLKSPDAGEAEKSFVSALMDEDMRELLRHVSVAGDAEDSVKSVLLAAELWWSVNREKGLLIPTALGNLESEDSAVAAYQWFHFGKPEVFEMEVLSFTKGREGWLFDKTGGNSPNLDISGWLNRQEPIWRNEWPDTVAGRSVALEKLPEGAMLSEAEAQKLADEWVGALNRKDGLGALALTAWMDQEKGFPPRVSRNLSYDLSSAGRAKAVVGKIYKSEDWVCARITFTNEHGFSRDSFLPLVKTAKGGKILLEVDLLAGGDSSRKFLNEASLNRFSKVAGKESIAGLKKLFEQFEKDSE